MSAARRGDYGFDAPYVLIGFCIAARLGLAAAAACGALGWRSLSILSLIIALVFAFSAARYLWTTRRGKFAVWSELLDSLHLRGDERLLDVGCGRGAVLLLAAERLPNGRAVGIDLWSTRDQSGNDEQTTLRNAELEGVRDRVELRTGDMRKLPFPDRSFDVVTSSLAIHNIPGEEGRAQALEAIWRVTKPGGTALIADIHYTGEYARRLAAFPDASVEHRRLDWRFWYGGPQAATSLVTMRRVAAQ
jgi:arsenite methyltransferase